MNLWGWTVASFLAWAVEAGSLISETDILSADGCGASGGALSLCRSYHGPPPLPLSAPIANLNELAESIAEALEALCDRTRVMETCVQQVVNETGVEGCQVSSCLSHMCSATLPLAENLRQSLSDCFASLALQNSDFRDCVSGLGERPLAGAAFRCVEASLARNCENSVAALLSVGSEPDSCVVAEGTLPLQNETTEGPTPAPTSTPTTPSTTPSPNFYTGELIRGWQRVDLMESLFCRDSQGRHWRLGSLFLRSPDSHHILRCLGGEFTAGLCHQGGHSRHCFLRSPAKARAIGCMDRLRRVPIPFGSFFQNGDGELSRCRRPKLRRRRTKPQKPLLIPASAVVYPSPRYSPNLSLPKPKEWQGFLRRYAI